MFDKLKSVSFKETENGLEEGIYTEEELDRFEDEGTPADVWKLSVEYLKDALEEQGVECLVS